MEHTTKQTHPNLRTRGVWAGLAACLLLVAVYLLTYTGRIELGDQIQYFDGVGGQARFAIPELDESAWQWMPTEFRRGDAMPLRQSLAEPLFTVLASPLYWIAERVPTLGLVHTVWLFNIAVTALLCGAFYAWARRLRFSIQVSLMGMLALGLLTILLPYSQTFFREPLMALFAILAALTLDSVRAGQLRIRIIGVLLAGVLLIMAYLSKDATLFALPGLACLLLTESFWGRPVVRRAAMIALVAALAVPLLLIYTPLLSLLPENGLLASYPVSREVTRESLHTYLLSLGGSFWGTSPVLLLALPGAALTWRAGGRGRVLTIVGVVLGFVVAYALLRGEGWFGGTIWPQRFLLPVIPFAMILTLPALERLLKRTTARWLVWLGVVVLIYSAWWQLSGTLFNWYAWGDATFDLSSGGLAYWNPGFNAVAYLRPTILTATLGQYPLNFAWVRAELWLWPVVTGLLIAGALLVLRRAENLRRPWLWITALTAVLGLATFGLLSALYPVDSLYMAERDDLHAMVQAIRQDVPLGDAIFIADQEYAPFFYNYGKIGRRRAVILPYHPGERSSADQPALLPDVTPVEALSDGTRTLIRQFARRFDRLWLLQNYGPAEGFALRPLERVMAAEFYWIGETVISSRARLIEYESTFAPPPGNATELPVDVIFADPITGETLHLEGVELGQAVVSPGDALPLSFYWSADAPTTRLYTVALFLAAQANPGLRVQGDDSWPGASLAPTTLFEPGVTVQDNRAVQLPPDLPAGTYQVWVKLYRFDDLTQTFVDMQPQSGPTFDAVLSVLPVTVIVTDP
jgi:hypothetical protein